MEHNPDSSNQEPAQEPFSGAFEAPIAVLIMQCLSSGVHPAGGGERCDGSGLGLGECLRARLTEELLLTESSCLLLQREHLKTAQQFFQLVGGSASECGAFRKL